MTKADLTITTTEIKAEAIRVNTDPDYIPSTSYLIVANGLSNTISGYIKDEIDEESNSEIEIEIVNPFFGADCSSFEYAMPAGTTRRAAAVKGFGGTFYGIRVFPDGSFVYNEIDISYETIFFIMPSWMTNSQAANNTALAVTAAMRATDAFIGANPRATEARLGRFFEDSLRTSLLVFGGSFQLTAPFTIRSPAQYLTNFGGTAKIDC